MDRPPCWRDGAPCPNSCAAAHYRRIVYNHTPLHGEWRGWRLVGRDLVNPHGERITAATLDRLMYRRGVLWP